MPSRDESLVEMPAITPDRDEIATRQQSKESKPSSRGGSGGNKGGGFGSGSSGGSSGDLPQENTVLMILIVVSMLIGLGGLGWAFTLQGKLVDGEIALEESNQRIAELEGKLSSTDESVNKSSVAMLVQLKQLEKKAEKNWQEVDKLWASAWRKNQGQINENKKQLAAKVKTLNHQIKVQSELMVKLKQSLESKSADVESLKATLKGISNKSAVIQKQVDGLVKTATESQNALGLQEQRIVDNEEWIQSINSHRKQINKSLAAMQKSVKELEAKQAGQSTAPGFQ